MDKYLVLGTWDPYIIEAESWEDAVWDAIHYCGEEHVVSITKIEDVDDE